MWKPIALGAMALLTALSSANTAEAGSCAIAHAKARPALACVPRPAARVRPVCASRDCAPSVAPCGPAPCAQPAVGLNCRRGTAILDEEPSFGGPTKGGLAGGECVWVRAKDRCADNYVRAVQGPPVKGGTRLRGPCIPEADALPKKD
jgi:hypothetical protein